MQGQGSFSLVSLALFFGGPSRDRLAVGRSVSRWHSGPVDRSTGAFWQQVRRIPRLGASGLSGTDSSSNQGGYVGFGTGSVRLGSRSTVFTGGISSSRRRLVHSGSRPGAFYRLRPGVVSLPQVQHTHVVSLVSAHFLAKLDLPSICPAWACIQSAN